MANNVFANGRELSCKSGSGKSIAAFPDVCMTPPENPATPPGVPVPYPNTGMASDTTSGSTTVKITGKEVMLKNKSYFKKSTGDEAGSASKKGVVTSVNRGKVYFTAWSMDVKIEGENAVRHLDMTTHNHGSATNTPPWPFADSMAAGPGGGDPCEKEKEQEQAACSEHGGDKKKECADEKCKAAKTCKLVPKGKDKTECCPPDKTGDHLIEDHWIRPGKKLSGDFAHLAEKDGGRYSKPGGPYKGAPCMCVNASRFEGKHGIAHATRGVQEDCFKGQPFAYPKGREMAVQSFNDANPGNSCSDDCVGAQLDHFYGPNADSKSLSSSKGKQKLNADLRAVAEAKYPAPAISSV